MRELVLHIGRHKTGTTAIQHFLQDNRKKLQEAGYYVPQAGRMNAGHHGFSRPLQRGVLRDQPSGDPSALPPYQQLREELESVDPGLAVIVSSEAFQNCAPQVVKTAFAGFSLRIVVYLRNQLEYLASAYAQRVHATDYAASLETFYEDVFRNGADYLDFLKQWESAFPREFRVRRYVSGNIIDDFLREGLDLAPGEWTLRREASNPSLNSKITEFKRQLNRRDIEDKPTVQKMYFALPRLNEVFPAEKVRLNRQTADSLVQLCSPSDNAVAKRYFNESRLFDYSRYQVAETPELHDDEFGEIYATLQSIMQSLSRD